MVNYGGDKPSGEYKPPLGQGSSSPTPLVGANGVPRTYADINLLKRKLVALLEEIRNIVEPLENDMSRFSLRVSSSDDPKLDASNKAEWPEGLGSPRDFIGYKYYKALRFRDTTSADYIRKRYEEAAREITGSTAIDILILLDLVEQETVLIQRFINDYIGDVTDASEHRSS